MKIEKTRYLEDMVISYCITDNVCMCCKHNPKNYCPLAGWDGKCKKSHESVVECINFKSIND